VNNGKTVLQRIHDCGAILVVRCDAEEVAVPGVSAMVAGGVRAIEIAVTAPGAISVLRRLKRELDPSVLLGGGTVMTPEQAEDAVDAGAAFLVSPHLDEKVVGAAKHLNVPIIPGGFTATEILRAWDLGADAVKVFPASVGGPGYIRALRGPYPQIPLIPSGGVDERTVGDFFRAGAFAVAAGGALFDRKLLQLREYAGLTHAAERFTAALRAAR
jgi:2-dehydro-3-deoxyphosphogluconate aldolase / (4S)-4-hydroxy-2-oxoglutarate aldolase